MPVIALFYGIKIMMYWRDHEPAHFHAQHADATAVIDILEGTVISGYLPRRQLKLVLAWGELHADDLMDNWELARQDKPLRSIEGLK